RLRVGIGYRQDRNLGDGRRLRDCITLRVLGGANAWSKRIARISGHVGDAAALHAIAWTHRSLRKHVTLSVAIVARIGVDQTPDGAMLGGHLRFDAPP